MRGESSDSPIWKVMDDPTHADACGMSPRERIVRRKEKGCESASSPSMRNR